MTTPQLPGEQPNEDPNLPEGNAEHQQVRLSGVTARVPSTLGHGAFATTSIVMHGLNEFVIDFVQQLGFPAHVVSRIVLPPFVVAQFVAALKQNLTNYEQAFGKLPELPKPAPNAPRPSIQEIYDNLKMSDDKMSGAYANAVLIRHSRDIVSFDFVTNFFPHSAVSSRVFVAASQARAVLDSLERSYMQYQAQVQAQRQNPPPPPSDIPPPSGQIV